MPHNQDAKRIFFLAEKKIVWKSLKIDPLESAYPNIKMFRMLRGRYNVASELFVKFVRKFCVRNVLVIFRDRIEEDAIR